ncbi:uncharacterized protein EV154DRAFT_547165 [Mucor mucedo]|uniref:uncharacterized protein n=1 Tax=Mucor mucedo TaxID=29922 RepID=UPI0022202445|nr:uncharacterized protein EV154DRAFT_547165 [Mucor mucedo]KAI7896923.1 hypothetical protein EV154DRAFT_547165 [Mucor mucedo]
MRFSFFMALMTLVLSFALLGQVEAKSRRLNKRRLPLERRTGTTNTNIGNNNAVGPTTSLNTVVTTLGNTVGTANTAATQGTGILGPTGAVGNAAGGVANLATTANGAVPGSAPPGFFLLGVKEIYTTVVSMF